jgi:hypothetical protein
VRRCVCVCVCAFIFCGTEQRTEVYMGRALGVIVSVTREWVAQTSKLSWSLARSIGV